MKTLRQFDQMREEGGAKLVAIAAEWGRDSEFFRGCAAAWRRRVTDAYVSLSYRDIANARAILERGLQALTLGPEILRRRQLGVGDVVRLIDAP